jgi:hypothetical protein
MAGRLRLLKPFCLGGGNENVLPIEGSIVPQDGWMFYHDKLETAHVLLSFSLTSYLSEYKAGVTTAVRKITKDSQAKRQIHNYISFRCYETAKLDVKVCYTSFQRAWKLTADDPLRWFVTYRETQRWKSFPWLRGAA